MNRRYCLNCENADTIIVKGALVVFCQKRMKMINDVTDAHDCLDYGDKPSYRALVQIFEGEK